MKRDNPVIIADNDAGNAGVVYQLELRRQELCKLGATWRAAIRPIPYSTEGLPAWGPSEQEMMAVRIEDVVAKTVSRAQAETEGEDDEVSEPEEEDEDEDLPIEDIEAFQRAQVYAENAVDEYNASGDTHSSTADDTWFAE